MEIGVGRGTVPREAWSLGTVVASGDNAMSAEHDRINRETFEEAMEVIKLAWYEERFSYRTSLNQLCSVDIVRVLHDQGGSLYEGAGCGLGKFQMVEKVSAN